MPKAGEINYVKAIGEENTRRSFDLPFGDPCCGQYVGNLATFFELLPPPPARVLDLGIGSGWTTAFLARQGYQVVGQDICPDMIEMAARNCGRYGAAGVRFVVQDYEAMGFRTEFDAAVFHASLHHAEDERAALAAAFAALKPGGLCLTFEPGEGHAAASAAVAEALGVTEKDMPPRHIIAVARAVGFRDFRVYPHGGDPKPIAWFDADAPLSPALPGRWRVAVRYVRKAIRSLLRGTRPADHEFLFGAPPPAALRDCNLVWMRK
jgi:SAM-dependent methyltransferase